jgi:hypothetical protein
MQVLMPTMVECGGGAFPPAAQRINGTASVSLGYRPGTDWIPTASIGGLRGRRFLNLRHRPRFHGQCNTHE